MGRKIKKEEKEKMLKQMIELYKQGVTNSEIARQLGVSRAFVSRNIKKLIEEDVIPKKRPKYISPQKEERYKRIIEWHKEGVKKTEMARRLGISHAMVSKHFYELIDSGRIESTKLDLEKKGRKVSNINENREQKQPQSSQYSSFELVEMVEQIKRMGYPEHEVRVVADSLIKQGMYRTCRKFIDDFSKSKTFSYKQQEALERMIELLTDLENKKKNVHKSIRTEDIGDRY